MFDSLEEKMKHDDEAEASPKERMFRIAAIAAVALLVITGLYYGVHAIT